MGEETVKENKNGTDMPKTGEPSEVDPCIEFKTKSGKRKFFENTELRLREKSGLSRTGLYVAIGLLVLLIVLFIVVIVLAATWPSRPHHLQFPVCTESACLRAAAQVQEAMNSSISPCKDVWAWACQGWLLKHPLPPDRSVWSMWQQLEVQEASRVRDLVTTLPLPLHTGTVEWKLKHLYEACLEVDNVNADQARPLTTIISELGALMYWQNDYILLLERVEMKNYDKKYISALKVDNFKFNRTHFGVNVTVDLKIDFGTDLKLQMQAYKFYSNEYRTYAIRFMFDFCDTVSKDEFGLQNIYNCGNFTKCPMKKGKYVICNWGPNYSKFPPYVPGGKYKVEVTAIYKQKEIGIVYPYVEVKPKNPWEM